MQRYRTRGAPFAIHKAPRMPKNSSKKPYLVPGPKARLRQGTFEKPRIVVAANVARKVHFGWCSFKGSFTGKVTSRRHRALASAILRWQDLNCNGLRLLQPREKLYTPPPFFTPFWPESVFQGEGGGVIYSEASRGRNFTPPSPLL